MKGKKGIFSTHAQTVMPAIFSGAQGAVNKTTWQESTEAALMLLSDFVIC